MIVLVLIDLDHRILPDVITLNGIWIGILLMLYLASPNPFAARLYTFAGLGVSNPYLLAFTGSLAGVAFGGGLLWFVREAFFRLRGVEGMGFGDVKMMAMVGAFLGLPLTLLTILLGSVLGSVIGIVVIKVFGKGRDYELPFGISWVEEPSLHCSMATGLSDCIWRTSFLLHLSGPSPQWRD